MTCGAPASRSWPAQADSARSGTDADSAAIHGDINLPGDRAVSFAGSCSDLAVVSEMLAACGVTVTVSELVAACGVTIAVSEVVAACGVTCSCGGTITSVASL